MLVLLGLEKIGAALMVGVGEAVVDLIGTGEDTNPFPFCAS